MSCGVGCRRGSDPVLLWLWCRPVATAPIRSLAWEPPYAAGAALEKAKKKTQKTKPTNNRNRIPPSLPELFMLPEFPSFLSRVGIMLWDLDR